MSHLWADRLHVLFAPGRVTVARVRGFARQVISHAELPVAPEASWQAGLQVLSQHVAGQAYKGVKMRVVLSGNLVRYLLVPGKALGWDDDRNKLILNHYFLDAYGAVVANWQLAVDHARSEASTLAAAIEPDVVKGLNDLAVSCGLRLASVQPALGVVANQWRGSLCKGLCWLVTVDSECAWVCLVREGQWVHLKRYAHFILSADNLSAAIQREKIFADVDSAVDDVLLYAPEQPFFKSELPSSLNVKTPDFEKRVNFLEGGENLRLALAA